MNIWCLPGTKLKFLNEGGLEVQLKRAREVLTPGGLYILRSSSVGQSSTSIKLSGFGDQSFNSVMFEELEPQPESQDKLHPDYYRWN